MVTVDYSDEPRETFSVYSDKFRVLVFDIRGSGHSGALPPLAHQQWVEDIEAIRKWAFSANRESIKSTNGIKRASANTSAGESEKEKMILAGGSYDGFVALEYAVKYPHHLMGLILRDTAASSKGMIDIAIQHAKSYNATPSPHPSNQNQTKIDIPRMTRLLHGQIKDDEELRTAFKELLPLYTYSSSPPSPSQIEQILQTCIFRYQTHNAAFKSKHSFPTYNVVDKLHRIECPTLILVGRADWVCTVDMARTIAEGSGMKNAQLIIFEQSGHSPQVEEKILFRETVARFLNQILI